MHLVQPAVDPRTSESTEALGGGGGGGNVGPATVAWIAQCLTNEIDLTKILVSNIHNLWFAIIVRVYPLSLGKRV